MKPHIFNEIKIKLMLCSGRCQELYTQLCSKPAEVFPRIMIANAGSQLALFGAGIGFFEGRDYLCLRAAFLYPLHRQKCRYHKDNQDYAEHQNHRKEHFDAGAFAKLADSHLVLVHREHSLMLKQCCQAF